MTRNHSFALIAAMLAIAGCDRGAGDVDDATVTPADEYATDDTMDDGMDDTAIAVGDADSPEAFVAAAAQSNMLEMQASEIAIERSDDADIRSLAQMIIDDHTMAAEGLMEAAGAMTVPTTLDDAHQGKLDDITEAADEDFAGDYLDVMEEAHEKAVAMFENYAENGENAELSQFAATTAPTLEEHLARVRELRGGLDMGDDAFGLGSGDDEAPAGEMETEEEPN